MLSVKLDEYNKITTVISCPSVEFPQTEGPSQHLSANCIRYGINGNKLAEYHGFDTNSVIEALEDFRTRGDGKFMTPSQFNAYKQMVIQICENERAKWQFKRELIEVNLDEEHEL
jgi:predicted ATP-grasp superfamily ATP-dependent carboligase